MQKLSITEARNNFMKLPAQTAKHEIILAVTRRNREVMAIMSWAQVESGVLLKTRRLSLHRFHSI